MTLSQRSVEAAARAIAETRGAIWTRPDHTVSAHFDHDAAHAAITAALAVDGLCLVPKEPTETMIEAGDYLVPVARGTESYTMGRGRNGYPEDIYRAMIAAANDGEERR